MKNNLDRLLRALMHDMDVYEPVPDSLAEKRKLLRALMNVRQPGPIDAQILAWQDEELGRQREEKGVIHVNSLSKSPINSRIALWRGDITRLDAHAIVNAANSQMLGCFSPLHNCIDNAIHSAAGMQLREECASLMLVRSCPASTGSAIITEAYNLPSKWVIHTVGPSVNGRAPSLQDRQDLAACYRSSLELACAKQLASIAFCCISTGVFGFPQLEAARIAVATVTDFIARNSFPELVIFNVFTEQDFTVYQKLLNHE